MIYHHSLTRAVAQAHNSDLIAEPVAYGRVHRWPRRWRLRVRRRSVPAATPGRAATRDTDPLRTDTAARCDEHIVPRPGPDAALSLGLMRRVVDLAAADRTWLAAHTVGWSELEARLGEWPVERAAAECRDPSAPLACPPAAGASGRHTAGPPTASAAPPGGPVPADAGPGHSRELANRRKQLSRTLARPRLRAGGQTRIELDIIGVALDAATSVSERTHRA
jgi:hypothetical protein